MQGTEKEWRLDLIKMYKYLKGGGKDDRARPFSVVSSEVTRGSGHKPKHRKFYLNLRKCFWS